MVDVSIVIPVYKVESFVERCLRSVMAQTYQGKLECILVDDCTPDRSIEIVQQILVSYTGNISFRIVWNKQNEGPAVTRNSGIKEASGEYVYFLDADDEITPNCIEELYNCAVETKAEITVGAFEQISCDGKRSVHFLYDRKLDWDSQNDIVQAINGNLYPVMAWNKMYRTDFLRKNQIYGQHRYYEDVYSSIKELLTVTHIAILDRITYRYLLREGSITNGYLREDHSKLRIDRLLLVYNDISVLLDNALMGAVKIALMNSVFLILRNSLFYSVVCSKDLVYREKRTYIKQLIHSKYNPFLFETSFISKQNLLLSYVFKLPKKLQIMYLFVTVRLICFYKFIKINK